MQYIYHDSWCFKSNSQIPFRLEPWCSVLMENAKSRSICIVSGKEIMKMWAILPARGLMGTSNSEYRVKRPLHYGYKRKNFGQIIQYLRPSSTDFTEQLKEKMNTVRIIKRRFCQMKLLKRLRTRFTLVSWTMCAGQDILEMFQAIIVPLLPLLSLSVIVQAHSLSTMMIWLPPLNLIMSLRFCWCSRTYVRRLTKCNSHWNEHR